MPLPLTRFQCLKMLCFLYSKKWADNFYNSSKFSPKKAIPKLAVIILSADFAILELYVQSCILNNTSYYIIHYFQNFMHSLSFPKESINQFLREIHFPSYFHVYSALHSHKTTCGMSNLLLSGLFFNYRHIILHN